MMGPRQRREGKLFYAGLNLDERVRADHPLRAIAAAVDFDAVRADVRALYGVRGNPSADPAVLMKLMFLLFYEQVPSERALVAQLPERLDWLWFCGYDLDDEVPDHSVISKARRRWGPEVFAAQFGRVLGQCVEAGLVDGRVLHVDSSLIAANADRGRLTPLLRTTGERLYGRLEAASGENEPPAAPPEPAQTPSEAEGVPRVSPTDPDARLTKKYGRTVLGYKDHRAVDDRCGIVTATETTDAARADGSMLETVLDRHEANTGTAAETVAADKAYGTGENYHALRGRGVQPYIPHAARAGQSGYFPPERFAYDREHDQYVCPAGERLRRSDRKPVKGGYRYYAGRGVCGRCPLKGQCTKGRRRQIVRHQYQEDIEWADATRGSGRRTQLRRRRMHRMEGSFGDAAARHGFKRARWRGLAKVRLQNLLIATIQNVRKLVKYARRRRGGEVLRQAGSRLLARWAGQMRAWLSDARVGGCFHAASPCFDPYPAL
jgi:transposase